MMLINQIHTDLANQAFFMCIRYTIGIHHADSFHIIHGNTSRVCAQTPISMDNMKTAGHAFH